MTARRLIGWPPHGEASVKSVETPQIPSAVFPADTQQTHLHCREGLVLEGDMGGLPGAQEELGGEAALHVEHVLLHRRVQVGCVLEVSPLLTVQDEAAGRADAALSPVCFPAASPTRSLGAGARDGSPSAFGTPSLPRPRTSALGCPPRRSLCAACCEGS